MHIPDRCRVISSVIVDIDSEHRGALAGEQRGRSFPTASSRTNRVDTGQARDPPVQPQHRPQSRSLAEGGGCSDRSVSMWWWRSSWAAR
jgi:hypothetical protein